MIAAALLLSLCTAAGPPPDAGAAPRAVPPPPLRLPGTNDALERLRAEQFTMLADARVTIEVENVTLREALNHFVRALPIPCLVRYADDPVGHGLDPKLPIDLSARDQPALDVLRTMLEACERDGTPCTWQLRRGFLEVGTKARLNAPAARELRMYPITDLRIDTTRASTRDGVRGHQGPAAVALDLLGRIVETIEPGTWDYGQERPRVGDPVRASRSGAGAPSEPRDRRPLAGMKPPTSRVLYRAPRYPALIRMWRDVLIVDAPPYYHRQIGGLRGSD